MLWGGDTGQQEDLLIKHQKNPKAKQTQPPPHPHSYTENRAPALDAFALFLGAGHAPRAELIRATGRVALSLAASSGTHISYFGSGRREPSRDHPAAALRSSLGSSGESRGRAGSGGERPAVLPVHSIREGWGSWLSPDTLSSLSAHQDGAKAVRLVPLASPGSQTRGSLNQQHHSTNGEIRLLQFVLVSTVS